MLVVTFYLISYVSFKILFWLSGGIFG